MTPSDKRHFRVSKANCNSAGPNFGGRSLVTERVAWNLVEQAEVRLLL
jgi:hypothetical protein